MSPVMQARLTRFKKINWVSDVLFFLPLFLYYLWPQSLLPMTSRYW